MATMMGMTAEQAAEAGKSLTFEKVWAAMDRYSAEADKRQAEAGKRFQELERVLKEVAEQHKETERVLTEQHKETERVLKEVAEQHKETERVLTEQHKETERVLKEVAEQHKETERAMRENDRVLTEQFKETDRRLTERFKETDRRLEKVTQNISKLGNTLGTLVETLVAARLWEKFKMYGLEKAYQRVPIYDENKRTVSEIDILLSNTDCAIAVEVKSNLNERDVDRHIERMELIRKYPPAEIAINNKRVMGAVAGGVVTPPVADYAHGRGFFVLELTGESAQLVEPPAGFKPKEW